jgi:hypothetical protein
MGARTKRWQLWLITMFILTGIIGMFQLFEGPNSVGAVMVVGGVANPSVGLPERSTEATELPAWQPSASESQSSQTRATIVTQRPTVVKNPASTTTHTTQVASQAPSTTSPVVTAKSVPSSASVSSTQPKATTTKPKPTTPTAKATTTAPRPTQSVLKPTASATTTPPTSKPSCYPFFVLWVCR